MRTSLVVTVLNEEKTITKLLESIFLQSQRPNEIIVVDGGSKDKTRKIIRRFPKKIILYTAVGNRSVGRNYGIQRSSHEIVLITDAGCILDKKWAEEMTKPFKKRDIDVVAGYYSSNPQSLFQKCLIPYVLVMPEKLNVKTFLPSSRSMAIRKNVWKKLGGFPEAFSHNEDYIFSRKMKKDGYQIHVAKTAIAYWNPRENILEAFFMFARFAYGDSEAGILRPKVVFLIVRYAVFLVLIFLLANSPSGLLFLFFLFIVYIVWSVWKNLRYIDSFLAYSIFPLLQLTSDIAIIFGTVLGALKKLKSIVMISPRSQQIVRYGRR